MGLLTTIKAIFNFSKELKKEIKDYKERKALYIGMTHEDLSALSVDELFEAVLIRTEEKVDSYEELEDGINSLNHSQKVFYSVNWLETEVNNGGLCQFFVNSSRTVAPYVSEYMGIIGATDHKELYDSFVSKNNIDLYNLSSFDIEDVDEFEKQNKRYPFDEYDEAFYEMEPLEAYLKKYIQNHLKDF